MSIGFNPWNLIRSLKSADQWGETINNNIIGATRNAYKSSEVMFGNGQTNVLRPYNPGSGQAGIQVAETQVNIGYTRINWKQGDIISTGIDTDFAIKGRGFFAVADPKTTNWGVNNTATPGPLYFNGTGIGASNNPQKAYLTKDGNFHFALVYDSLGVNVAERRFNNPALANEPVLVNSEGLVVLTDNDAVAADNSLTPLTYSMFIGANKVRPSIFEPTLDTVIDGSNPLSLMSYDELKFSKYGSTIYDADKSTMFKTIVNGSNGIFEGRSATDLMDRQSRLIEKALEGSNVSLDQEAGQLSASQDFYEALTKNFMVYLDNIDSSLRLFR